MFKMAEKFLSDPSLKENNIAKKTYFLKDDRIRLVYHLGEGKLYLLSENSATLST